MNERGHRTTDWIGDSELGERFPAWTRGNAADVFPDPVQPARQGRSCSAGVDVTRLCETPTSTLGALSYDEFEDPESPDLFKMFGGYVYNPLTLTRILGARMPGASPEMIDKAFFDERDEVPPYEEQPWHVSPDHEATPRRVDGLGHVGDVELPELDADRAHGASRCASTVLTSRR